MTIQSKVRPKYFQIASNDHSSGEKEPIRKRGKVGMMRDHLRFCVEMYKTLLPRMNASPYLFFSCPFTYSFKSQIKIEEKL